MTTAQELEKLVIRLVGEGSDYDETLNHAVKQTEKAANKIARIGKTMKRTGMVLTGAVTLPVAGMVAAYASFDDAMTKSTAIMSGVTAELREEMERTADSISQNSVTSARDLAESYYFLASAGLSAEQSIAALPKVEKFAVAGAFDMATATDLLTDAQSALGLVVDDTTRNMQNMTRVGDVLVKANTLANASVQQFSEALTNEAGAAIKQYNIDLEEGVAILATYADQGLKGNVAGSMMARMTRLLIKSINDNRGAFEAMNIDVEEFASTGKNVTGVIEGITRAVQGMGPSAKAAALEQLGFQARVQQAILPLIGAQDAIRGYQRELQKAGGTTEDVANKQMMSFSAQVKILWNQIASISRAIGKELAPYVAKLVDWLKVGTKWFLNLSSGMKKVIAITLGVLAALGPVLVVLGTLVGFLPAIISGFAAIAGSGVAAAIAGAIGPIAAVVAGLALVGYLLRDFAKKAVVFIKNIGHNFKVLMDWLPQNWHHLVTDLIVIFGTYVKNMANNTKTMIGTLIRLFALFEGWLFQMWRKVFSVEMLKWIWDGIKKAAAAYVKFAKAVFEGFKRIFTGGGGGQSLKELAGKVMGDAIEGATTKDVLGSAAAIIRDQAKHLRKPLEGFESSIKEGPKFITELEAEVEKTKVASGIEEVGNMVEELNENADVQVRFSVQGIDAVIAGTADALARVEEFRALRGGVRNVGGTKGTVAPPTAPSARQTSVARDARNRDAQQAMLKVLEAIEENTRAASEGAVTLAPAAV